jgi:hypothetical protein
MAAVEAEAEARKAGISAYLSSRGAFQEIRELPGERHISTEHPSPR